MNRLSQVQKYEVIGRFVSFVSGRALSNGSSVFLIQMFRVPSSGFRNEMNRPSGEICPPEISGSPKNSSRSRIGGGPDSFAAAANVRNRLRASETHRTI